MVADSFKSSNKEFEGAATLLPRVQSRCKAIEDGPSSDCIARDERDIAFDLKR